MLPEHPASRAAYIELRDCRTRWRGYALNQGAGDMAVLQAYILDTLASEADLAGLREILDFAQGEDFLTQELQDAAQNLVLWGQELARLLRGGR